MCNNDPLRVTARRVSLFKLRDRVDFGWLRGKQPEKAKSKTRFVPPQSAFHPICVRRLTNDLFVQALAIRTERDVEANLIVATLARKSLLGARAAVNL